MVGWLNSRNEQSDRRSRCGRDGCCRLRTAAVSGHRRYDAGSRVQGSIRCLSRGRLAAIMERDHAEQRFCYEEDSHRHYPEKILYLNVRRDPGTLMNCAVFVLGGDDLAAMNSREWIYDGVVVTRHLKGVRIEGGDAVMYAGKAEHVIESPLHPSEVAVPPDARQCPRGSRLWRPGRLQGDHRQRSEGPGDRRRAGSGSTKSVGSGRSQLSSR